MGSGERDVLVIGAGPAGLAVGTAARQAPARMTFFTTPDLLEIGGLPFVTPYDKPTRAEALRYYRRVADTYRLEIVFGEKVGSVEAGDGCFAVHSRVAGPAEAGAERVRRARHVVFARTFIENGRFHGAVIVRAILAKEAEAR